MTKLYFIDFSFKSWPHEVFSHPFMKSAWLPFKRTHITFASRILVGKLPSTETYKEAIIRLEYVVVVGLER